MKRPVFSQNQLENPMNTLSNPTAPDIAAMATGWIVLGRAPRKRDMQWPQWEPMGESEWRGHSCLMRRHHCTIFATEAEATEAVARIKTVAEMFGLDWHTHAEFRLVPLLHTTAAVPDKGV
jgi:hypothetical protein